jgi:hypothetical protein
MKDPVVNLDGVILLEDLLAGDPHPAAQCTAPHKALFDKIVLVVLILVVVVAVVQLVNRVPRNDVV